MAVTVTVADADAGTHSVVDEEEGSQVALLVGVAF